MNHRNLPGMIKAGHREVPVPRAAFYVQGPLSVAVGSSPRKSKLVESFAMLRYAEMGGNGALAMEKVKLA